jgi:hypothetical protein
MNQTYVTVGVRPTPSPTHQPAIGSKPGPGHVLLFALVVVVIAYLILKGMDSWGRNGKH